jgi:hypothetical protein
VHGLRLRRSARAAAHDRAIELRLPLAEGDVAQPAPPVTLGPLQMDVLAARCGILAITGTHAEFIPDQPLCRARLRVVSVDSSSHSFSTREQLLVLDDGTTVAPSRDAMLIKRQADKIELGARNAVELDVWWTVPGRAEAGSRPAGGRPGGDGDRADAARHDRRRTARGCLTAGRARGP